MDSAESPASKSAPPTPPKLVFQCTGPGDRYTAEHPDGSFAIVPDGDRFQLRHCDPDGKPVLSTDCGSLLEAVRIANQVNQERRPAATAPAAGDTTQSTEESVPG